MAQNKQHRYAFNFTLGLSSSHYPNWHNKIVKELPDPVAQLLDSHQIKQSSKIYDRTGEILLYEIYNEEKELLSHLKKCLIILKATISIEDKNFYNHIAFDWRAILRAFKQIF